MKCPRCGGTAYAYACEDENGEMPIKCPWCGYSEVQTNEEWFCGLSTEEKAKMLGRVSFCDFCPHQLSKHCAWTTGYNEDCVYGNKENEELWLNWLKEKHE